MNDLTGQSLGRYHILEKLGEGGMATVYKAYDTRLERNVAVKVIRRDAFSAEVSDLMLQRFEREAKALSKLIHANIVPVIDYGDEGGTPYLVMPLIEGGTLKDRLAKHIFNYREAARLIEPVARALGYAHARGILHRDVKPSNILITDDGDPTLSDFGVAKILESNEGSTLTGTGVGLGTPEYMAPEQWLGQTCPASDQYSLGVVFYEMVTGRKPYTADTPAAVLLKQANEPLPRPRNFSPDLPERVEQVLFKVLAREPGNRYASMVEFATALEGLWSAETPSLSLVEKTTDQALKPEKTTDPYATVSDLKPAGKSELPTQVEPDISTDTFVYQPSARKLKPWMLGAAAGGLVVVLLIIGVASGWFTRPGRTFSPTTAPLALTQPPDELIPSQTNVTPANTQVPATPTEPLRIGSTMVSPRDGMTLVYVPAGDFLMGSVEGEGENDERPQHKVYMDAFWIDRTEVTNAMFTGFVKETGYQTDAEKGGKSYALVGTSWEQVSGVDWQHPDGPSSSISGLEDHPVVHVSWNDASAYCAWAGRRLPTEAEWEKAARGTDGLTYPWGNTPPTGDLANFADSNTSFDWADKSINDGYAYTAPVGSYADGASPYGALDVAGNVWEWVTDWYAADYYTLSPTDNPRGPVTGEYRVLRGGSWRSYSGGIHSAIRSGYIPTYTNYGDGFRCAQSIETIAASQSTTMETLDITSQPVGSLGIGSTMVSPIDGMTLVYVPAGEFLMGSPEGEGDDDEHPQHTVTLDAFWIDRTEVTNAMYAKCVADQGCEKPENVDYYYGDTAYDNHPMVFVTWHQAVNYCTWVGRRLPTEAEWEKAARGTDTRTYPWGNEELKCSLAQYEACDGRTIPVGSLPGGGSPYGALDMAGNVWEWVSDWYSEDYYAQSPTSNPTGPDSSSYRIVRGGSRDDYMNSIRSARRVRLPPSFSNYNGGFRCALSTNVSP